MNKIMDRDDITKSRPLFNHGIYDVVIEYQYSGKPTGAYKNCGNYTHCFHGMSHDNWDNLPGDIRSYFDTIAPLMSYHAISLVDISIYEQDSGEMVSSSRYEPWLSELRYEYKIGGSE